jgi:hypothetical protein
MLLIRCQLQLSQVMPQVLLRTSGWPLSSQRLSLSASESLVVLLVSGLWSLVSGHARSCGVMSRGDTGRVEAH